MMKTKFLESKIRELINSEKKKMNAIVKIQTTSPDQIKVDKNLGNALGSDLFSAEYFTTALASPPVENL